MHTDLCSLDPNEDEAARHEAIVNDFFAGYTMGEECRYFECDDKEWRFCYRLFFCILFFSDNFRYHLLKIVYILHFTFRTSEIFSKTSVSISAHIGVHIRAALRPNINCTAHRNAYFRRNMSAAAQVVNSEEPQSVGEELQAKKQFPTFPAPGKPKHEKLGGYDFYRSIGSPKFVVAPMVDQSELVRRPD